MSKKKFRPVCLFDILVNELRETSKYWGPDLKLGLCQEVVSGFLGFKSYASLLQSDTESEVEYLHSSEMPWLPLSWRIFTHPSDVVPNLPLAYERTLKGLTKEGQHDAEKSATWVVDYLDHFQKNAYRKPYYDLKYQVIRERAISYPDKLVKLPIELLNIISKDGFVDSIEGHYGSSVTQKYQDDILAAFEDTSRWEICKINGSKLSKVHLDTIKAVIFGHFYYGLNLDHKLTVESLITFKKNYMLE